MFHVLTVPIRLPAIYVARTFLSVITSILEEWRTYGSMRRAKNCPVSSNGSGVEYLLRLLMRSIRRERLDNYAWEAELLRLIKRSSFNDYGAAFLIYLYLLLL